MLGLLLLYIIQVQEKKFLININFIKIYLSPDTHKTDILKDN